MRDEIGGNAPLQSPEMQPGGQPAPTTPQQDPTFTSRIKQLVKEQLGLNQPNPFSTQHPSNRAPIPGAAPVAPAPDEAPAPERVRGRPRSLEEIKQRIQEAGRQLPPVMIRMLYHNRWRDVEPYSYRYRDADDPHIPLFFGYCHKDDQIEAFKLKKIQDVQVTQQPFNARYVVEF